MSSNDLSLQFCAGDVSGWTPVGVSSFRGLRPTAAIRELIQNGLDAAGCMPDLPAARMHFEVRECPINEIPGITAYRKALAGVQASLPKIFGGKLPDNAEAIMEDIEQCLAEKTCLVLYVLDNGVGLNKDRMRALLGDGVSVKGTDAMGSYGNGHVVAFPASDLRYVLYGGVSGEGMIVSGHAILASRENEREGQPTLGKDGYLVKQLRSNDLLDRYVFYGDGEIPGSILEPLDWIKSEWKHGSVVAIPGFNYFREQDGEGRDLRNIVFHAAACNFFEAIYRKELVIDVQVDGQTASLNAHNIEGVLAEFQSEKRSMDSFLSGNKAYEAFLTLRDGREIQIDTPMGLVGAIVRHPVEGSTRTDLCRSGMWITDRLPRFQNQFGNLEPFHCLLPLRLNEKFNRLVRKSEGPLHNGVQLKLLKANDRKQLGKVFSAIRDQLHKEIPELDTETFRPNDIFLLPTGGFVQGGELPGVKGTASIVRRGKKGVGVDDSGGGAGGSGGSGSKHGGGRSGEFKKSGRQVLFRAMILPTGPRSCRTIVVSDEELQGCEMRFAIDESIDVTSDSASNEAYAILNPESLKVGGKRVQEDQLVKKIVKEKVKINGKEEIVTKEFVLGVLLGEVNERGECMIEMEYSLPDDLPLAGNRGVILKAEMIRRKKSTSKSDRAQ